MNAEDKRSPPRSSGEGQEYMMTQTWGLLLLQKIGVGPSTQVG